MFSHQKHQNYAAEFQRNTKYIYILTKLFTSPTLYMTTDERYRLISSTLIKEIARYGRRLHGFVPNEIEGIIFDRLSKM